MKRTIKSGLLLAVIASLLTGCGGGGGGGSTPKPTPSSQAPVVSSSSSSLSSSSSSSSSSVAPVEPIAVKSTSYLNKNVDFTFSIYDLFDKWDSVSRKNGTLKATESVGLHATGYADFQQNGAYSIIVNTSFLGQHDSAGKPYHGSIVAVDKAGKNITSTLIDGDTTGCIHPRKALVADFNNDGLPDVFFACHGDDIASTPGETSRIVLSHKGGKYTVNEVQGTEFGFAHSASAADIDGDGNVDVVIADTKFNENSQSLRVLMGVGNGTFIDDSSRIDMAKLTSRDAKHANYYSVDLIEINSTLHIIAGGNEIDSDNAIDGDEVPTVFAPFKNGYVDHESVVFLPGIDDSIPLDFVTDSHNNIYVLRATADYTGMIVQKVSTEKDSSVLFSHKGAISTKNPGSWIPFFEIVNDKLFSVNGDIDFIFDL
jgi:hypothetical protein